jgi:Transposase DDE domain
MAVCLGPHGLSPGQRWRPTHSEGVLAANCEGALLEGPPHKKQKPRMVSTTDPDCAMATSNRRSFAEASYKQHVAVDDRAGVIVDVAITRGDANEGNLIERHVDRAAALIGKRAKTVTADAGYAYGKVYAAMEARGIDPVIPAKAGPTERPKYRRSTSGFGRGSTHKRARIGILKHSFCVGRDARKSHCVKTADGSGRQTGLTAALGAEFRCLPAADLGLLPQPAQHCPPLAQPRVH